MGLISLVDPTIGMIAQPSLYTKEIHNKENYDTTAKSSSISAGGSITANTGTTTVIGSNLDAKNNLTLKSDIGSINVLTSQELSNASTLDKKTEINRLYQDRHQSRCNAGYETSN